MRGIVLVDTILFVKREPCEATRRRCLALLATLLLVAGCGVRPRSDSTTVRVAIRADVTGFYPNPSMANEGFTIWTNFQVFEGLTALDDRMRVVPGLAEGWENPDDRTYVFHLRQGLRFSDGRPLTTHDVVASLLAARSKDWVTRNELQAISQVRALDGRRVSIETRYPYLVLPRQLVRGLVLPATAVEQSPVPAVGSGPYEVESWHPGRGFVLVRNPYYRGPRPYFERGEFQVVPEAEERVRRLRRGEFDVVDSPPLEQLPEMESGREFQVYAGAGNRVLFLCLRLIDGPLADPRVREAIDLALDRHELARRVYGSRALVAEQIAHPGVEGFVPELERPPADKVRARALLAQAGFPDGFSIRLDGPNNRYVRDGELLREVARQLGEVGVQVQVAAVDKAQFFSLVSARRSGFHLLGWAFETGDAGDMLAQFFHTPQGGVLGNENTTGVSDPELDRLVDEANATRNPRTRADRLRAAVRRVGEVRCVIPLVIQPEAVVMSRRLSWNPPLNFALKLADLRPVP